VKRPPIVAVSGPSGSGKTRLLARLIPALAGRGVRVAVLKRTRHDHPFDRRGKDTEVLRRAGAVAAAIEGPRGLAYFGPPAGGVRALAALLPDVDLVLAEGWKGAPLPRVEVHRRRVSRQFLCATDRRVVAIVTDEPPPRPVPTFEADAAGALAAFLCDRFGLRKVEPRGRQRLRVRPTVSRVSAEGSERTDALGRRRMAKTTNRKGGASRSRGGRRSGASRSAAGRKGGNATLRARGPEFYSEIGRKGGKKSGGARRSRAARTGRSTSRSGTGSTRRRGGSRGGSRAGSRRGSRSSSRSSR
jgi:molybdopterin-guanine dinucleotide biosynthesis protein MobB